MELYWSGSIALDVIRKIIATSPQPKIKTQLAKLCAEAIGLHIIMLILTASDANLKGRHSCAVSLFRGMEDALDCFAAVCLIPSAAEKWAEGDLKASDAARLWEPELGELELPTGEKAIEYRKTLRNYFNPFAHCVPYLTDWNAYPAFVTNTLSDNKRSAELRFNHKMKKLEQNAIRIGAYLTAHVLEFIQIIKKAYDQFLKQNNNLKNSLERSERDLETQLNKFGAVYLEEMPPELKKPILKCANGKYGEMHFIDPRKHRESESKKENKQ